MKYLLLILLPIIMFSSCTENIKPVEDPKSVELKYSEADKDTMLVLVIDEKIMLFDQTNQLVYKEEKDDTFAWWFAGLITAMVLFLLIGVITNS